MHEARMMYTHLLFARCADAGKTSSFLCGTEYNFSYKYDNLVLFLCRNAVPVRSEILFRVLFWSCQVGTFERAE